MRFKKILLVSSGVLLVVSILAVWLTPLLVKNALRFWIANAAERDGLRVVFEKIEAPLLRPVVLEKIQITSQADTPFQVMVEAPHVEIDLNFTSLFGQSHGRFLRSVIAEAIKIDIRRNFQSSGSQRISGRIIEDLLADNFQLSRVELHVENGDTIVELHDATLSGAQMEAGIFSASNATIVSPWFRKDFPQLRGVTSWQDRQLTVGALALMRGLDLDGVTIDLSHIGESRLGLELALDAFGGKFRARISNEERDEKRTWDVAGAASEVSLAQMSDALDLTDRASGSLHACKFTFRGEVTNLREATASIWAEVTEMTWRDRTADTIMIGASLYNKQVQVEQLFVKQRNNQFVLSGESALPQKWSDWLNPDFHGDISASINDLGDFARLFGGSASDFAGKIDISGKVTAHERKLGGQLSASGNSLTLFRAPFESLKVELSLRESQLEISEFELRRESDSFHGHATLDLAKDRSYSFSFTSAIAALENYADLIPKTVSLPKFGGSLDLTWTGHGTETSHFGTLYAWGHDLYPLESPIIPFEAEFECEYSPENVFCRQFNLSNKGASFSAFVTVANDYLQLQSVRLDVHGKPKLEGDICLPLSYSKLQTTGSWLASIDDNTIFDLNVAIASIDLAELAGAVTKQPRMSGQASGNIQLYGPPGSLEGKSIIHLRDFVFGNEPAISADLDLRSEHGLLNAKMAATPRNSSVVNLEASMPFGLEKRETGYGLKTDGPFSGNLNFPAVLLSKLPRYVSPWMFVDGILSGRLTFSDSLAHPQIRGSTNIIDGRFLGGALLSTGITFGGQSAAIDFIQLGHKNARGGQSRSLTSPAYSARGEIDFRDFAEIRMRILPNPPVTTLSLLDPNDCINEIELSPNGAAGLLRRQRIDEIDFHGALFASNWTISLNEKRSDESAETTVLDGGIIRTFTICSDIEPSGKSLTLGIAQLPFQ